MQTRKRPPKIIETLSTKPHGPYMLKAEIVSYSNSKPILSINRYRAKVRDIESGDYEYEYAGRTGFDVAIINWLVFEKVFEQAVLALNELDA